MANTGEENKEPLINPECLHSPLILAIVRPMMAGRERREKMNTPKNRVNTAALLCPGLGRVNRGYERFAEELFSACRERMDIVLFKGGGPWRD